MKCPICKSRQHVEIDLHSDGFSKNIRECGDCGGVWTFSGENMKIIKGRDNQKAKAYSDFICPTCKSSLCIKTDLDAFQFHEEIQECTQCGTICSTSHDQLEVVKDSQAGSFLNTTSDSVESDDYVFI